MNDTTPLSIRIRTDLKDRIEAAAVADGRTTSSLVSIILQRWLDANDYRPDFDRAQVAAAAGPSKLRRVQGRPRVAKPTDGMHHLAPAIVPWIEERERVTLDDVLEFPLKCAPGEASGALQSSVKNLLVELGFEEFMELQDTGEEISVWIRASH